MNTKLIRPSLVGCSLAFMLLAVSSASADTATVPAKEKAARAACLAGDYVKGVAILAELFVDSHEPTYIFNQGRCFEQNGRSREAIDRFREYLRIIPAENTAAIAEANKHIADSQVLLEANQPGAKPAPVPSPGPLSSPRPDPVPPPTPVIVENPAKPISDPGPPLPGSGLRTTGVILAATGGAALVTGALLNLKVNQLASDMEAPGAYSRNTETRRADYATLGWISYGVGGALVAGGVLLYYLGGSSAPAKTPSLAFVPALAPGHVGVGFQGGF